MDPSAPLPLDQCLIPPSGKGEGGGIGLGLVLPPAMMLEASILVERARPRPPMVNAASDYDERGRRQHSPLLLIHTLLSLMLPCITVSGVHYDQCDVPQRPTLSPPPSRLSSYPLLISPRTHLTAPPPLPIPLPYSSDEKGYAKDVIAMGLAASPGE